ncbi:MAG TPA: hypothetical protein VFU36_04150, partial [Jatrophihabitans sp.]|nr:hypothetical protein [Jatrophihabitans sp.]
WGDQIQLKLVAAQPGAEAQVWSVYSDGYRLEPVPNTDLPGPPRAIAAALGQSAVVWAGGSIWKAVGADNTWVSLAGTSASPITGTNPVYVF